jgi:hypothetical protein
MFLKLMSSITSCIGWATFVAKTTSYLTFVIESTCSIGRSTWMFSSTFLVLVSSSPQNLQVQ